MNRSAWVVVLGSVEFGLTASCLEDVEPSVLRGR